VSTRPTDQAGDGSTSYATLDALSTETLRDRAFTRARHHGDVKFFWNLIEHLPSAGDTNTIDGSTGSIGTSIEEMIGLWRQLTGHEYGEQEPVVRAAFIDYLSRGA
jgi:hypothetical protein